MTETQARVRRRPRRDADGAPPEGGERPIRVLWLIKGLGRGGAEMLLLQAARLRDRTAFECEIGYLLGSRGWLADDFRAQDVPVHLFRSERHVDLRWARRLRRHLREHPVDLIHVHSPLVAAVARIVARSLPRRVRPRTISTEHLPWSGHARATRLVNAVTFHLDDAHLAVSDAVVESMPARYRRNVRVLVHGVPVNEIRAHRRFRNEVRSELGIEEGEVLVGTVANVTSQKGYPDLMAAARKVVGFGRHVRFAMIGRGTADPEIVSLRDRAGLGDRVLLLGPVEDAPRLMAACDIFALASHWEGLPLVLMESLALGLPIVATRVGGVSELVRDGVDGTLVPPRRPDLLARAIDQLVMDKEQRDRMSHAGAEGAMRFDNHEAVRTIEALYREVAATRQGGGKRRNARRRASS